jgi:hypothetical protein
MTYDPIETPISGFQARASVNGSIKACIIWKRIMELENCGDTAQGKKGIGLKHKMIVSKKVHH